MKWCSNIYIYVPAPRSFWEVSGHLDLLAGQLVRAWNMKQTRTSRGAKAAEYGDRLARSSTRKNLQSDLWPRSSIPLILIAILNQSVPRRPGMGKPTKDEEESEKIEITDFDDVLKHIGGWGPFQVGHQNWFTMCDIDYCFFCTTELLRTILQH